MRFSFAREPRLEFGNGAFASLGKLLAERDAAEGPAAAAVLVSGSSSLSAPRREAALKALGERGAKVFEYRCPGEPSPDFVDAAVAELSAFLGADKIAVVVGVGGGSAMDAGKAIAAMLPAAAEARAEGRSPVSVQEYLEGVGTRPAPGSSAFYIAVPTTAGTGTEATKNAVISRVGPGGFKKSLRHDAYVPAAALVDGELAVGCPRSVGAASGLDALTQLLESYLSPAASRVVDALVGDGIAAFAASYERMLADGNDADARSLMAYAAYQSGVGLANAGLGSVHALASPVGGRFDIPHGVVCGLLLAPAARLNVDLLLEAASDGERVSKDAAAKALAKCAAAARLLGGRVFPADADGAKSLVDRLEALEKAAGLSRLSSFGIGRMDLPSLAAAAATKTNPVPLNAAEYEELLASRL